MASPSYYDIENSFLAFCSSKGLAIPGQIEADGRIHRFKLESDRHGGKSGAYCVWPEGLSHDGKPHGFIQDHRECGEKHHWQFFNRDNPPPRKGLTAEERAKAAARGETDARQEAERRREALKAAWDVYQAGRAVEEAPNHPYLLEKRVRPVGPLRVGSVPSKSGRMIGGVLLIPLLDVASGKFAALHRVFPWRDKETGKFPKGWHPGTSGGIFLIAGDVSRGPVFAAEGIATALTTYDLWIGEGVPEAPGEYVPSCTVIACMDSGNLIKQSRMIRQKYHDRRLMLVRDDDAAGQKAALAALDAGFDGVVDSPVRES